jgi:hypothetical protein
MRGEAGADRIDEDDVGDIEQAVGIVEDREWRRAVVAGVRGIATRFGPKAPMCSHKEPEPGPPLNRKVIGRFGSRGSFT